MATRPPPLLVKTGKTGSTPVIVSGHQKRPCCSIEASGNVVKIQVSQEPRESPPGRRSGVRIKVCPRETGAEGRASPADSGTCSDADSPLLAKGREASDDEISSDSLNSGEPEPHLLHALYLDEDYLCRSLPYSAEASNTIRSAKGTVRGVKNRVRTGIATFLQINTSNKSWMEKEAGKIVVYTTTMGIVRETAQRCTNVRNILRTNMVKFVEKDAFMSREVQAELRQRMDSPHQVQLPQLFVEGRHIGDAETVEKLNEIGELRQMLKPYKNIGAWTRCETCGGYGLLPCGLCNGSKKSVHRNHFTTELVALKCMNCDEVGLIKCPSC